MVAAAHCWLMSCFLAAGRSYQGLWVVVVTWWSSDCWGQPLHLDSGNEDLCHGCGRVEEGVAVVEGPASGDVPGGKPGQDKGSGPLAWGI